MVAVDLCPVDLGDVAQVWCVRPVVRHDCGWCRIEFGVGDQLCAEYFLDGERQSAVSGEQRNGFQGRQSDLQSLIKCGDGYSSCGH